MVVGARVLSGPCRRRPRGASRLRRVISNDTAWCQVTVAVTPLLGSLNRRRADPVES